jgi:nucleotide-binding universal stress UspA family protein
MIAIKKVLVATDFSPVSETALVYGRALARTFGGTLHVLHVVENFVGRFPYADAAVVGFGPEELQAELEQAGRRELEAAVTETDRRELQAVPVFRVGNSPARAICEYAKEAGIDVIVIGATGRGAVDRMLMGSVADKVIRRAPCPVLAVRSPEHEFVLPDALQVVTHANG